MSKTKWLVEIEPNVWLAPWSGDPGRTLKIENAQRFASEEKAIDALKAAQQHRRFGWGRVTPTEETK